MDTRPIPAELDDDEILCLEVPDDLSEIEDEDERAAIAEGIADADAGRLVPHEEVVAWVKSWGTENELPMPKCPGE